MKRSLIRQTAHTFASMLSGQGAMIVAGIMLSRVYGPAGKGMTSYAGIAIMAAIAIADGLGAAVANRVGSETDDPPAAYAAALRIIGGLSLLLVPLLVALGLTVHSQHTLLFVAAATPFALYLQTMNGFYLVQLRIERSNYATLATNALTAFAMVAAMALLRPPIDAILAIWVAGYVVGAAIVYHGLRAVRAAASRHAIHTSLLAQVRFATRASAAALMNFLSVRVDVFIVSATLSAVALGNYTLALAVGEVMWQASRALSWSAYGRVATLSFADAAALTARVTRIVVAVELGSAVVLYLAGPALIAFVYGTAFAPAGGAMRFLLPGMAIYAADAILTYFISVRAGRPGTIVRIEVVALAICGFGTLYAAPRYGIAGPAVATTITYLVSFGLKAAIFKKLTGLTIRELLVPHIDDVRAIMPNGSRGRRTDSTAEHAAAEVEHIPA